LFFVLHCVWSFHVYMFNSTPADISRIWRFFWYLGTFCFCCLAFLPSFLDGITAYPGGFCFWFLLPPVSPFFLPCPSGRIRQVQYATSYHNFGTMNLNLIRISTVRGHAPYKYPPRNAITKKEPWYKFKPEPAPNLTAPLPVPLL